MDINELKSRLQDHFTDGLVTVVGSGLSVAEGVPGMKSLAQHLNNEVPKKLSPDSEPLWQQISADLDSGIDLETTLLTNQPDPPLETTIVELTANLILKAEASIVQEVISGTRTLRFSRLLKHMLKPNTGIPVVTTNYDRLIEVAAEAVGLGVDSLFVGQHIAGLNPRQSQLSLCRSVVKKKKSVYLIYSEHLVVLKPHGSLDWFLCNGEPMRCPLPLSNQRLIITPGLNKFRGGYDRPFDSHRERANKEIDGASRFLILGYGFNDDHLQTHLEPQLKKGKRALLITYELSKKAKDFLTSCDNMLAISAKPGRHGAVITTGGISEFFSGPDLWDLGVFIDEVLEP